MNESEIITRNKPMLGRIVNSFMRKVSSSHRGGMIDREDLMQEVTICFLLEVRQYGEEEAARHKRTLYHALYVAVIGALPVKTPYYAYAPKRRQSLIIEQWDEEHTTAQRVDDAFSQAAVIEALEGLEEEERLIIHLKLEGLTQREIGHRLSMSAATICRRMKRIRRQFEQVQ